MDEKFKQIEELKSVNCRFCMTTQSPSESPLNGNQRLDLVRIRETNNFVVLPDALPVHPDGLHMLVIPKTHVYGLALLKPVLGEEVQQIIGDLELTLAQQLAIFEHGSLKHGGKNQSIYHAHVIAASGIDVIDYMGKVLAKDNIQFEIIRTTKNPICNIQKEFKGTGYFFGQQDEKGLIAHDYNDIFPSQMTQKSLGVLFTGQPVDWKLLHQDENLARLSYERITNLLQRTGHL